VEQHGTASEVKENSSRIADLQQRKGIAVRMSRSAVTLAVAFVAITITVTPSSQDFGDTAISGGHVQKNFAVAGIANRDSASATLTGRDASEWTVMSATMGRCTVDKANGTPCEFVVGFDPTTPGPKTASLIVRDYHGNRVSVPLTGRGVQPICVPKVVFCNYAHLYSGVFSWNYVLRGPGSSSTVIAQADIRGLDVTCNATETIAAKGSDTHVFISKGKGLVAVEFKVDDENRKVYNITVACPTPGNKDTPSQPAELGHFDQQTYDQLKTDSGVVVSPGVDLCGTSSSPAPEADDVNGITGTVVVTWELRRKPTPAQAWWCASSRRSQGLQSEVKPTLCAMPGSVLRAV
jgi:hypothetical protein